MKILIILLLFIVAGSSVLGEVNTTIVLRSIAEVESSNKPDKIGRAGERSRYQFMSGTWVLYSKTKFEEIGDFQYEVEIGRVAKKHIETIKRAIISRGWEVTRPKTKTMLGE